MAARGGYKGGTGKAVFQNAPGAHIAAFFVSWIKSPLASVKCHYGANKAPTRADMGGASPACFLNTIQNAPGAPCSRFNALHDKIPTWGRKAVHGANNALVRRHMLGPSAWTVPEMPSRTRQAPRKAVLFTYTIKSLCRFLKCRYGANMGFLHRDFLFCWLICVFRSVFIGGYSIKPILETSIFTYLAGLAFRFRLASGFYIQPLKRIPGFVVYGDFI